MYAWMTGVGWVWVTFMMFFWVVLIGAVIYLAVRLGQHSPGERRF